MRIDVSSITKVNGASLSIELQDKPEWLKSLQDGYSFDEPLALNGEVVNMKGILRLEGRLTIGYTVKCYRCLKDIKDKVNVKISENFVKEKTSEDEYLYEGNFIEIDKALEDNILLNLPMKQVCTENCKGLCGTCGKNLNEEKCNCSVDTINPKMEALKNFFDN